MNNSHIAAAAVSATDLRTALEDLRNLFIESYSDTIREEYKLAEALRYDEVSSDNISDEEYSRLQRQYLNLYENKPERTEAKIIKLAEKAWAKRYNTLVKGIWRKGVDTDNLAKLSVQALGGFSVQIYIEDTAGNKASAYSVVAAGDIRKTHLRFICR